MSKQHKVFKNKKKKQLHNNHTTFDPKIHHRSNKGSGYGLKKGHVVTPAESSGNQLAHLFNDSKKPN